MIDQITVISYPVVALKLAIFSHIHFSVYVN